ncbi:hypothetical protein HHK36_033355 [Tetracentron sinense]|uniref:Uncharacterized protein n=1 Tax=Tetracentron sinense TaxID=13715 RepID=A0A834Y596_TETSI|nr:hypothetical protein HHK36_033355 [Tetracentron sinense]
MFNQQQKLDEVLFFGVLRPAIGIYGNKTVDLARSASGVLGLQMYRLEKFSVSLLLLLLWELKKCKFFKSMGVDHAVDLSKGSIIESVKEFLKARKLKRVDGIYVPVGGKAYKRKHETFKLGSKYFGHRICKW